jgi:integrase
MPRKKLPLPAPKRKRRPRGTGYVFYDARRKQYVARVPNGKSPNGRTRYREVRADTQGEAVAKMRGMGPPGPDVTVGEWSTRWLAGLTVRASTRTGYEKQVTARLVPSLGGVRVADLTVSQVRSALNDWRAAGVPTANRTLRVAATMFATAVLDGLAVRNPFSDCPRLPYDPPDLDPFSPAELKALLANGYTTAARLLAFLAGTGARIGEAAALDVPDYDRATGRVSISKTWSRDHGTRPPKSKHSRRTITVPLPARAAVEGAIGTRTSGPLFLSRGRARFSSAQIHIALNRVLKRLGLRGRNPHAIRHGFISAAVGAGAPIADVARHAGHSVGQLVRVYLHPTGGDTVSDAMSAVLL